MSMEPFTLARFLVEAKRRTYAAQGDEATVSALLPGSRQLEYREGALLYRDVYFGFTRFAGQEVIYLDGSPVWTMVYSGGMTSGQADPAVVYAFLRRALGRVTTDRPYRGPGEFAGGPYLYLNKACGSIECFQGTESIAGEGKPVYELHYGGGFLG